MDLKGMPNGSRATKAADEKLPVPQQRTVFELGTVFCTMLFMMRQVHWAEVVSGDNSNGQRVASGGGAVGRGKESKSSHTTSAPGATGIAYRGVSSAFPLRRRRKKKESRSQRKIPRGSTPISLFHHEVLGWNINKSNVMILITHAGRVSQLKKKKTNSGRGRPVSRLNFESIFIQ